MKVNNEFYVTLPFNLMINDGLIVKHFESKNYFCLGTPKDVEIIMGCDMIIRNLKGFEYDPNQLIEYFKLHFENEQS